MKLVAKRDFANVPSLGLTIDPKTPGFKHPKHVHKGYRFEIGTSPTFDGLNDAEKKIVAELKVSHAVADASDLAACAKIDEEVADDKKLEKRDKHARREPWTRGHKLQIAGMGIALFIACLGWYRAAHQSPVY